MQAIRRAINAYGHASETLAPAQQIVLLYEGAIRRVKEAQSAVLARRINERCRAVQKATAIIEDLQSCLDHERGGEIARNLDQIYTHVTFSPAADQPDRRPDDLRRGDRAPGPAARGVGAARGGQRDAGCQGTSHAGRRSRPGGDHLSCGPWPGPIRPHFSARPSLQRHSGLLI